MRFWDSSAILPLLVAERASSAATAEFERDPDVIVWWGTEVEGVSALARLEREGHLDPRGTVAATDRLSTLAASWEEVQPVTRVRTSATRLLRVHPLRAADALQLAAAIAASEDEPRSLPLVTLDDRLAQAAAREGFPVIRPGA